jgi:hypothetical protein
MCIAYIYFDYKNMKEQTADNVIRVLLKQLLLPLDSIPCDLQSVYDRRHLNILSKVFLVRQLLSTSAIFHSVYIVLDGLDECNSTTFCDMVNLVRLFKESGIKVFCTFGPTINLGDLLDVPTYSISAHEDDVRNYLSIRLTEGLYDQSFQKQIIDRLVKRAEGKWVPFFFFTKYIAFC